MDTTRRLPDGELAVMQALWDLEPPVTSGELQQQLKESHPMALTTLLTVLTRLAEVTVQHVTAHTEYDCK